METRQNSIVRLLRPADIPAAMRLKEAAGWNQTERDWANVLELEPEGCFGIECDGALVATTTAVCYGRALAWIGMVLTAPEYRGRGFARALMEHALEFLEARQVEWVKLDATDMGQPLYRKLGFEDECAIERLHRTAPTAPLRSRLGNGREDVAPNRATSVSEWFRLDREAFGADRGRVLESIAVESTSIPGCGYALGRPGSKAAYFGPCVARTAEAARALLEWFLAKHPGEDVYWDLLPGNVEAPRLAREFGFEPRRRLVRMARRGAPAGASFAHNDAYVYAIAGFEYG